jgi:hypothetical protein
MPVLLSSKDAFQTWLSDSPADAFALARSFDLAKVRIVQSGLGRRICSPLIEKHQMLLIRG